MASKRNRQRRLERERAERRVARHAETARRRRQIRAGVGAGLALLLIVVGTVWLLGGFKASPPKPVENVARGSCTWNLKDATTDLNVVDVKNPPTDGERRTGTESLTIKTNLGTIEASMDLSKTPCTAVSLGYLGAKSFYEGSRCHRLDTHSYFLQCGDPHGDGLGTPSYSFADESLPQSPVTPSPAPTGKTTPSASPNTVTTWYPKGTIVMANTGANTNGGQFYIVYEDGSDLAPSFSIVGHITKGLDIIEKVAKAGAVDGTGAAAPAGKPKTDLVIGQLYVGAAPTTTPSPTPSSSPTSAAPPPAASTDPAT